MAMVDRGIVYCSSYCQIQDEFECKSFQKREVLKGLYWGDTAFVISAGESPFFRFLQCHYMKVQWAEAAYLATQEFNIAVNWCWKQATST